VDHTWSSKSGSYNDGKLPSYLRGQSVRHILCIINTRGDEELESVGYSIKTDFFVVSNVPLIRNFRRAALDII
jgi:hypothetical protein